MPDSCDVMPPIALLVADYVQDIPLQPRIGQEQQFELSCKTLKLPPNPTVVHMKKMYVRLSREYHPDKQFSLWDKRVAHDKFIALDNAYKYLSSLV